jgi:hypothetical protein
LQWGRILRSEIRLSTHPCGFLFQTAKKFTARSKT